MVTDVWLSVWLYAQTLVLVVFESQCLYCRFVSLILLINNDECETCVYKQILRDFRALFRNKNLWRFFYFFFKLSGIFYASMLGEKTVEIFLSTVALDSFTKFRSTYSRMQMIFFLSIISAKNILILFKCIFCWNIIGNLLFSFLPN